MAERSQASLGGPSPHAVVAAWGHTHTGWAPIHASGMSRVARAPGLEGIRERNIWQIEQQVKASAAIWHAVQRVEGKGLDAFKSPQALQRALVIAEIEQQQREIVAESDDPRRVADPVTVAVTITRPLRGGYTAGTRKLHGCYTAVTRLLHDCYMTVTNRSCRWPSRAPRRCRRCGQSTLECGARPPPPRDVRG